MPNFLVYLYPTYTKRGEKRNNGKRLHGETWGSTKGTRTGDPINALKSDSAAGINGDSVEHTLSPLEKLTENQAVDDNHVDETLGSLQVHEVSITDIDDAAREEEVQLPNKPSSTRHGFIRDFLGNAENEVHCITLR